MAISSSTAEGPAPVAPKEGGALRATVDLATLDDSRLTDYRHPDERRTLLGIVAAFALLVLILALMGPDLRAALRDSLTFVPRGMLGSLLSVLQPDRFAGLLLIFFVGTAGVQLFSDWLKRAEILADAAEVTETTFPQQHKTLEELRRRFSMPTTRVFVYRAPPAPYSFGVREPYIVVFPSVLLGQLTPDEFQFSLGRELGSIKLGHTRVAPLLGSGRLSASGPAALLEKARNFITSSYLRSQALSCDRIGALAARSARPAVDRAIKQAIQPPRGAKVEITDLLEQTAEVTHGLTGLALRVRQLGQAQPDLLLRLRAITDWAGLPPPPEPAKATVEPAKPTAVAQTPPPPKPAGGAADAASANPAAKVERRDSA
jgi:Zn-dependent protease with chaperone function